MPTSAATCATIYYYAYTLWVLALITFEPLIPGPISGPGYEGTPSHAKNHYLNSRLMIPMQVSWQQSYSTRSRVQDVRQVCDINRDCKSTSVVASRAWYYQIKMASNNQLSTGRELVIEMAGLILLFC